MAKIKSKTKPKMKKAAPKARKLAPKAAKKRVVAKAAKKVVGGVCLATTTKSAPSIC